MTDYAFQLWMKSESVIQTYSFSLTASAWGQVLPRDPLRFMIIMPMATNATTYLSFSNNVPSGYSWYVQQSSPWLYITREDLGDMMCEPLWANVSVTTANNHCQTASYNPNKWEAYRGIIDRYLSQLGT